MGAWTVKETRYLRGHAALGAAELARRLRRSEAAVRKRAHVLGISLRRPGETRGPMHGGSVRRPVSAPARDLCPACGAREIAPGGSGFCRPCTLRHLAEEHRREAAELAAERELWAARQAHKRARDLGGAG